MNFSKKPAKLDLPINYEKSHWTIRKQAREQYCEEQDWLCWYCDGSLLDLPPREIQCKQINKKLFPKTMFDYPVHLHHDHSTGMTIGAVHARCNAILWQYEGK